jgi:hypothetical protein
VTGRRLRFKLVGSTVAAFGAILLGAGPASAHTLSGAPATNYRSDVVSMTPALPQVHVRLLDLGRRVQLTNDGPDDVVVLGYLGEPYLRVGPGGAFENRRSPAVYQNRVAAGPTSATTLPPQADATAPPSWQRISTAHTVTWHDQRTRWEGTDPVEVRQAPRLTQIVVPTWTIGLRHGDTAVAVQGRITWVPGPSPWPWLALALALAVGCAALGRLAARPASWLAAAVALVVALDALRSVGVALAARGPVLTAATTVLGGGVLSVLAWIGGLIAIDALQRGRQIGPTAAGTVGLILGVYAVADSSTLSRSQVSAAFSATFARVAVAGTLGLGFGLVAAAILAERRLLHGLRSAEHVATSPGTPATGMAAP